MRPGSERLPLVDLRLPVVPSTLANADAGVVTAKMADASVQTVPSDYNPVWGGGVPCCPTDPLARSPLRGRRGPGL